VGIALRSLWDVGGDLRAGRLVRILPDVRGSADAGIFAVHPRTGASSGAAALLRHLQNIWAHEPPWEQGER